METADGKTIYPTFEDAAYEWMRLWAEEGCTPISEALGNVEGTTRALFYGNAKSMISHLKDGCHDEAEAVMRALGEQIKDVPEQIEVIRLGWPKGCPECGNNEITIQETRTFTVILDRTEARQDTMEEETNPGCNTTTYSCTKCGHQEIEG